MDNFNFVQGKNYKLAGSGCIATATEIILSSFTLPDEASTLITMAMFGNTGYMTLEPGTSKEENISFTGVTQNANGTATLTGVTKGLGFVAPYTTDSALKLAHAGGTIAIVSNSAPFYNELSAKDNDETITSQYTFTDPKIPKMDVYSAPTDDEQLAPKKYVDDVAAGGTVSINRVVVAGIAGETVAAGKVVYFDETDKEWKLADGSASATCENVLLGIAQGVGTNGVAISGGVLLEGFDSNQTGFTAGDIMYISDASGVLAATTGTITAIVGYAKSATEIYFKPGFKNLPTQNENNALVGNNTDIAVGTGNKFVTQTGLQKQSENYGASAAGTDTYAVTLSPAPTSYVAGMVVRFKADVANTDACTLNVNGLGAVPIQKAAGTALADNDILAGQMVEVVYNDVATDYFQLIGASLLTPAQITDLTDGGDTTLHIHNLSGGYLYKVVASDNLHISADTEQTTTSGTYVKKKSILITKGGTYRVKFNIKNTAGWNYFGRIYKNGVAFGTERTDNQAAYVTISEDLAFAEGDYCELYIKNDGSHTTSTQNFRLYYDETLYTENTVITN